LEERHPGGRFLGREAHWRAGQWLGCFVHTVQYAISEGCAHQVKKQW